MFTLFFSSDPVTDYQSALKSNVSRFARFFRGMLERGVLLLPSQFEAAFISLAHDEEALEETIRAAEGTLGTI